MNTVLNVVLLIAVAALFAMQFMSKSSGSVADEQNQDTLMGEQPDAVATIDAKDKIVYVNSDTLMKNYKLSQDVESKFILKRKNVEARLAAKEKEITDLDKKYTTLAQAQMLTQEQAVTMQQEGQEKYMEYQKLKQNYTDQLAQDYERYLIMVNDSVLNFLERYRVRNNYTFIFQYSNQGSALLAVDPSLNVTDGVLQEINALYEENKPEL